MEKKKKTHLEVVCNSTFIELLAYVLELGILNM